MLVCTLHDRPAINALPPPKTGDEVATFTYLAQGSNGDLTPPGVSFRRGRSVWFDDVTFERGRRLVAHVNYSLLWAVLNQDGIDAYRVYDADGLALYDGVRLWCLSPVVTVYEPESVKPAADLLALLRGATLKMHDRTTLYVASSSGNWRYRFYEDLLLADAVTLEDNKPTFTPTYAAIDAPLLRSGSVRELLPRTRGVA